MARPQVEINWKEVGALLEAGCSGEDIAGQLGISTWTLYRRCKTENYLGFSQLSQQKRMRGDNLLRVKQFSLAMDGDKTMLVWLGKNRLGQRDKLEHSGPGGGPVTMVIEYVNRRPTGDDPTGSAAPDASADTGQ